MRPSASTGFRVDLANAVRADAFVALDIMHGDRPFTQGPKSSFLAHWHERDNKLQASAMWFDDEKLRSPLFDSIRHDRSDGLSGR